MSLEFAIDLDNMYFDPQGRVVIRDEAVSTAIVELFQNTDLLSMEVTPQGVVIPDAACPDGDNCPDPEGDNCPDTDAACPEGDNCPEVDGACPEGDNCPDIDVFCPSFSTIRADLIYPINPEELIIKNGKFAKSLIDAKFGPATELLLKLTANE